MQSIENPVFVPFLTSMKLKGKISRISTQSWIIKDMEKKQIEGGEEEFKFDLLNQCIQIKKGRAFISNLLYSEKKLIEVITTGSLTNTVQKFFHKLPFEISI